MSWQRVRFNALESKCSVALTLLLWQGLILEAHAQMDPLVTESEYEAYKDSGVDFVVDLFMERGVDSGRIPLVSGQYFFECGLVRTVLVAEFDGANIFSVNDTIVSVQVGGGVIMRDDVRWLQWQECVNDRYGVLDTGSISDSARSIGRRLRDADAVFAIEFDPRTPGGTVLCASVEALRRSGEVDALRWILRGPNAEARYAAYRALQYMDDSGFLVDSVSLELDSVRESWSQLDPGALLWGANSWFEHLEEGYVDKNDLYPHAMPDCAEFRHLGDRPE